MPSVVVSQLVRNSTTYYDSPNYGADHWYQWQRAFDEHVYVPFLRAVAAVAVRLAAGVVLGARAVVALAVFKRGACRGGVIGGGMLLLLHGYRQRQRLPGRVAVAAAAAAHRLEGVLTLRLSAAVGDAPFAGCDCEARRQRRAGPRGRRAEPRLASLIDEVQRHATGRALRRRVQLVVRRCMLLRDDRAAAEARVARAAVEHGHSRADPGHRQLVVVAHRKHLPPVVAARNWNTAAVAATAPQQIIDGDHGGEARERQVGNKSTGARTSRIKEDRKRESRAASRFISVGQDSGLAPVKERVHTRRGVGIDESDGLD